MISLNASTQENSFAAGVLRWVGIRLGIYLLAAFSCMAVFTAGRAFYVHVWPGLPSPSAPKQIKLAPPPPLSKPIPPALLPAISRPADPVVAANPPVIGSLAAIARAPAPATFDIHAWDRYIGTEIFDPNTALVGRVEKITSDDGNPQVVVSLAFQYGQITFPMSSIVWTVSPTSATVTFNGVIASSVGELRSQINRLSKDYQSSVEPIRVSVPAQN